MRRALLVAAVLLAAFRSVRAEGEDPKERQKKITEARKALAEADRQLKLKISAAIEKGAKWLEKEQSTDGTWPGFQPGSRDKQDLGLQALCILTLAKCGRDAVDPSVAKGLSALRGMYDGQGAPPLNFKASDSLTTYSVATMLMMYEALYHPQPGPKAPGDRYAKPKGAKDCKMPRDVEAIVRDLVAWLVSHRAERVWRYPWEAPDGKEDLSNTQYALLGLAAAARCGIETGAEVYERALAYVLDHQQKTGPEVVRWIPNESYEPGTESERYGPFLGGPKDKARGWTYIPDAPVTGSMTTAGIAALAICKDRLKALDRLDKETAKSINASMIDGLAWIAKEFKVDRNPGGGWHYYYLYGLERAGAMTGLTYFGKRDWYREGADYLVYHQSPDGWWPEPAEAANAKWQYKTTQTCFALLFLSRASVPPSEPIGPVVTSGN